MRAHQKPLCVKKTVDSHGYSQDEDVTADLQFLLNSSNNVW